MHWLTNLKRDGGLKTSTALLSEDIIYTNNVFSALLNANGLIGGLAFKFSK